MSKILNSRTFMNFPLFYQKIYENKNSAEALCKKEPPGDYKAAINMFYTKRIENKLFYLYIFLIKTHSNISKKIVSPLKETKYEMLQQDTNYIIPDCFEPKNLAKTFRNMPDFLRNNQIFIDYLTYGTLPTIFDYFQIDLKNKDFFNFICQLKNNDEDEEGKRLQVLFSRCLFSSPFFLNFLDQSFYPVFQCISGSDTNFPNIHRIQQNLYKSIKNAISIFPKFIKLFFEQIKSTRINLSKFLSESLFKPMTLFPEMYFLFYFGETDLYGNSQFLRNVLEKVFDSNFIDNFIEIIQSSNLTCEGSLSKDDQNMFISYNHFFTKYDLVAFECIEKQVEFNYEEIAESIGIDRIFLYHFRSSPKPNFPMFLMKLLLLSLPKLDQDFKFEDHEEVKTPDDFILYLFEKELKSKDGHSHYPYPLIIIYSALKSATDGDISATLGEIPKFTDEEEEMWKQMKSFMGGYIANESAFINKVKSNIINLYITVFTREVKSQFVPPSMEDAIKCPMMFNKECFELFKKSISDYLKWCPGVPLENIKCVVQSRFYKNLMFYDYLIHRPDLIKFDKLLRNFTSLNFHLIDKVISFEENQKNRDCFMKANKNMNKLGFRLDNFRAVFEDNNNPIQKFKLIEKCFNDINCASYKLLGIEPGGDFLSIFSSILTFHLNLPRIYSNLVFLSEFVLYPQSEQNSIFVNYLVYFFDLVKESYIPFIQPCFMSRACVCSTEVVVSGESNDMILRFAQKILNGVNSDFSLELNDVEKMNSIDIPIRFNVFEKSALVFLFQGNLKVSSKLNSNYRVDEKLYNSYFLFYVVNEANNEMLPKILKKFPNFHNICVISYDKPKCNLKLYKDNNVHVNRPNSALWYFFNENLNYIYQIKTGFLT